MNAYRERRFRSTTHHSWPHYYMEVSNQLHALAAFPLWKAPPPPQLDRRQGGPNSWSQRFGVEKNLLLLPGIEPWPSSLWPVAILSELSPLHVNFLKVETNDLTLLYQNPRPYTSHSHNIPFRSILIPSSHFPKLSSIWFSGGFLIKIL
jgi:hypothetical protein